MGGLSQVQPIRGRLRTILLTTPAAGAEFTQTVPTGKIWRIRMVRGTLTTAVAVATRIVALLFNDGTNIYAIFPVNTTQAASLTRNYNFAPGAANESTQQAVGLEITQSIPNLDLLAGYFFRSSTFNLQAADQWSGIIVAIEEFDQP